MKKRKTLKRAPFQVSAKLKTFIYELCIKVKWIVSCIKTIHENIKSTTESDIIKIFEDSDRNPYQLFFVWFLDIVVYGIIMAVILFWITTGKWWLAILALGLLRWFLLDTIYEIKKSIKRRITE